MCLPHRLICYELFYHVDSSKGIACNESISTNNKNPGSNVTIEESLLIKGVFYSTTGGGTVALLIIMAIICIDSQRHCVQLVAQFAYGTLCFILLLFFITRILAYECLNVVDCWLYPMLLMTALIFLAFDFFLELLFNSQVCCICL